METISKTETLIIFDYSGTLSIDAVLFSQPENLLNQLKESGLMDLGITSRNMFWEDIVNPAWDEGSTTSRGYRGTMFKRIREILRKKETKFSDAVIADSVSCFVENYLNYSRIDSNWQSILKEISSHPGNRVIIATDHYAEATASILKHLKNLQIEALAAKEAFIKPKLKAVIVANSADIGCHKNNREFWEILKSGLKLVSIRRSIIIDDFGCNEQEMDAYADRSKVEYRQQSTVKMLKQVFSTEIKPIAFFIKSSNSLEQKIRLYHDLIESISSQIKNLK